MIQALLVVLRSSLACLLVCATPLQAQEGTRSLFDGDFYLHILELLLLQM